MTKDTMDNEGGRSQRDIAAQQQRERNRRRLRTLIIGTLAASGAFQLNGWQVQAHGNRSSHSIAAMKSTVFRPQDYSLLRQELTAPNAADTVALSLLYRRLNAGLDRDSSIRQADQIRALILEKAALEDKLRLRETVSGALRFLRAGQIDAGIAVIEGEGQPERVLQEYLWSLLDIAYLGRENDRFGNSTQREFSQVAKAAIAYCDGVLASLPPNELVEFERSLKIRIAEIYHNIASFTLPDVGDITADALEIGLQAALKGLKLRQELGQNKETMIANWMVGRQYEMAGETESARRFYELSIEQAQRLNDAAGLAWGKSSLASMEGPGAVRKLGVEVDRILDTASEESLLLELLRYDRSQRK